MSTTGNTFDTRDTRHGPGAGTGPLDGRGTNPLNKPVSTRPDQPPHPVPSGAAHTVNALEIEKAKLEKLNDKASQDRLAVVKRELADAKGNPDPSWSGKPARSKEQTIAENERFGPVDSLGHPVKHR